jgi:hypothetical protein
LRISQYDLKTAVLDSTTYEEATSRYKVWLFQRSRWIKGYFQTYLVHMRHPLQALQKGHYRKFLSLQLIVGVWTVVLLINPFMWALTLIYMLFRPVQPYSILFPGPILYMGAFCLIFGNFFYVYIHLIGCLRRKEYALIIWVLLIPLYWVMMSVSAYIAFYQLIVKPHYWEKTQHGNHLAAQAQAHTVLSPVKQEGHEVLLSLPTARVFAVTVGKTFKQVASANTLERTTQRVTALRSTLSSQLGHRKVRRIQLQHVRDLWFVTTIVIASITSIASCWYFFQQHEILLYQDALSHMRISRSVFDNVTPGLAQLGSVWLPLPHILMWPFIWNDFLWHSGLAGSFVAMPFYVIASVYIFLSAKKLTHSSIASFIGTLEFVFNPNILYLQSTPLSETVCIVTLAMTCYYFLCWIEDEKISSITFTAGCCFLSTLARYDGWVLCLALCIFIPLIGILKRQRFQKIQSSTLIFAILGGFGIILWFAWNKIIFGDPLYFKRSVYSSEAQQMIQLQQGRLYTYHSLWESLRYYIIDSSQTVGIVLFVLAVLSLFWFFLRYRLNPSIFGVLAFLTPFALYVAALYSGNAILWIPGANPPDANVYMYNVRYGSQIVAPVALGIALLAQHIIRIPLSRFRQIGTITLIGIVLMQNVLIASQGIITVQDGLYNYACSTYETPIIDYLIAHFNGGMILQDVYTTQFDVTEAGLDFKNVIYEGSGPVWSHALQNPAQSAEWIVVKPDSSIDIVAQHINLHSTVFLSQFQLVVRQSNNVLLYHRLGEPPLPNHPVPPPLQLPHFPCFVGKA